MSEIKVNKLTPRVACGTVTLGDSGDTIALGSGASQTGFGRTGTVDWDTTIQTSTPFTAVSGKGYFINTTAGAITMNLPTSPSVGDIVAIKDYAGTFNTYNLTIGRGGSNMDGAAADSVRSTDNESLTLVYADATKGWIPVEEGTGYVGETFISATGGTPCAGAISGNCKIHTFTGPGTFTVNSVGACAANNVVSYIVVAGGGGSGGQGGQSSGGGGAGGYRELKNPVTPYTASPLDGYATPANRITVTATGYPIGIGGGGPGGSAGSDNNGTAGTPTTALGLTSTGGGYGGGAGGPAPGGNGGSGGGGRNSGTGGTGNTPPTTPAQGMDGGDSTADSGSGGGGATGAGGDAGGPGAASGNGGTGATSSINATPTERAGGGAGGMSPTAGPSGTNSGGGGPGIGPGGSPATANGTDNTGGGAGGVGDGGGVPGQAGANGGSGVVIIRYKFQ